jgi:iron-sulfur cluster assembly protein
MINITPAAQAHIIGVLDNLQKDYLFFGVRGGGCAGFEYYWEPCDINDLSRISNNSNDIAIQLNAKKSLIVDAASQMYLVGSTIDYKTDMFNSQLTVENALAKSSCGCGTSVAF